MEEVTDELEYILWVHEYIIQYLEKAYHDDIKKVNGSNQPVGWRTLNAIQKGVNRRLVKNKLPKAPLDTIRAAVQIYQHELTIEQETVEYPLRPDSSNYFRLTSYHWLNRIPKEFFEVSY